MLNDINKSELISRSVSGMLNLDQQKEIELAVLGCKESKAFAALSRLIQDSLCDVAEKSLAGDSSIAPGLSHAAKLKIKQTLHSESVKLQVEGLSATVAAGSDSTFDQRPPGQLPLVAAGEELEQRTTKTRFSLLKEIGRGGLGTVWLARDEMLRRKVAVKEMNPEAAEFPRAWERFQREAEITGQLEHPNVVPLYEFGIDSVTGQPFYAMRFVGKRTLVDAIEEYHDRRAAGEDVTMDLHRLLTAFSGVCQGSGIPYWCDGRR